MEEKRLPSSPITYYTENNGKDTYCLFLHAAFADSTMFSSQLNYFRDKYNIILVDLLGHGKSKNGSKNDSIDRMAEWIEEILKAEGVEKSHIVGVSLGGVLAQDFANRYPLNVLSLSCFGSYDINNFNPKLQKGNTIKQVGMIVKALFSIKWFSKENRKISAVTEKAQEEFYNMNLRFPKKSFIYLRGIGKMVNTKNDYKRTYPILIGCGDHDVDEEKEALREWKESDNEIKTAIISGAGHLVNMDNPLLFNKTLEKFWLQAERKNP